MAGRLRGIPWYNLINVVESGDSIFKTGTTGAFDAGADTQGILGFVGDCYLEFRAAGFVGAVMGFSDSTGVSAGIVDLQFGIYLNLDHFEVLELSAVVYDGGAASHTPGQVMRVERVGSTINYKRNGTTQYTHALTAAQAAATWYVDLSIASQFDALYGWQVWTADPEPAWVTAAKQTGAKLYHFLSITFPQSGKKRFTTFDEPVSVVGDGHYEPKVKDWGGPITFASGDRTCALQTLEWTVEVDDTDRMLAKIFGSGEHWQNAPVLYQTGGPTVPAASRNTEFSGYFKGPPVCSGPMRYRLTFTNMPPALSSPFLRRSLSRQDFAGVSQDAIGQVPPLIYGRHYSEGTVDVAAGMLPAPVVQGWNGSVAIFLVGYGIPSVQMVYKDGVAQTTAGTWSATFVLINGTFISIFTVPSDPGTSKWTFDANGFDWNADGTGVVIEHAVDILKHILANFILPASQWGVNAWLTPDPTLIDLPSFADAKLFLFHKAGARFINGQQTGLQVINDWCQTFQIQAYITPKGKVGLVVQAPSNTSNDLYDAPMILSTDGGDIQPEWPTDGQAKRITSGFLFSGSEGRALGTHNIFDPSISQENTLQIDLPFTPSLTVAPPTFLNSLGGIGTFTLQAWWNALAQRQLYNGGDAVSLVYDTSGNQRNLTQGTGANQPIFQYDILDRRAWFTFDGVNDTLTSSLPLSTFKGAQAATWLIAFRPLALANNAGLMSDLTKFDVMLEASGAFRARNDDGVPDTVDASATLRTGIWYVGCVRHDATKLYSSINDGRPLQMANVASGATSSLVNNLILGESSFGVFANVDIAEVLVCNVDEGEITRRLMAWMLSRHVYRYSSSVDTAKEAMSRYLNLNGRPAMRWTVTLPPDYWHKEAGQIVKVQNPMGPSYLPGWGFESWSARPGRILAPSWNPGTHVRQALIEDVKLTSAGWWETGQQQILDTGRVDMQRREGRARVLDDIFSRPWYSWAEVPNAGGSLLFELCNADTEQGEARGVLIQQPSINYLKRSSNFLGIAGIAPGSLTGTGVNGSNIVDGAAIISGTQTNPFPKSYLLTAGNPHTTDLFVTLPTTDSIPNTNPLWVSIIFNNRSDNSAAGEVVWKLFRNADSTFWNDSGSGSWGAGSVWNSTGLKSGVSRFFSKKITPHSGASTFSFSYGLKTGGAASRIADICWAGLSTGTVHAHGVIPNDSLAATVHAPTATDEYRVDCPNGVGFSLTRGSFACRVRAGFTFADMTGNAGIITHIAGGGTGIMSIKADNAANWTMLYNGTTLTVSGAPAVSRYDYVDVAARWTSSIGELGTPSTMTLMVRVNGGAWFSGSAAITPTTDGAAQAFFLGGALADRSSLWFERGRSWLIPLADAELQAWFG